MAGEGVSAEVIDLVSIAPLDRETVRASVRKTGRLLAIDDDYLSYGVGAEILASVDAAMRGVEDTSLAGACSITASAGRR